MSLVLRRVNKSDWIPYSPQNHDLFPIFTNITKFNKSKFQTHKILIHFDKLSQKFIWKEHLVLKDDNYVKQIGAIKKLLKYMNGILLGDQKFINYYEKIKLLLYQTVYAKRWKGSKILDAGFCQKMFPKNSIKLSQPQTMISPRSVKLKHIEKSSYIELSLLQYILEKEHENPIKSYFIRYTHKKVKRKFSIPFSCCHIQWDINNCVKVLIIIK